MAMVALPLQSFSQGSCSREVANIHAYNLFITYLTLIMSDKICLCDHGNILSQCGTEVNCEELKYHFFDTVLLFKQ